MTLQGYDLEAKRLREEIAALPKLAAQAAVKAKATAGQRTVVAGLANQEDQARRRQEADVKEQQAKIVRIRRQLDLATDTKQVSAFEREIAFAQGVIDKLETEQLESMERSEQLTQQLAIADKAVAAAEANSAGGQARAQSVVAADKVKLAAVEETRTTQRATVGESSLLQYDRIARAKGTGIAEVLMQKCTACQMMQRPQRWNDIRDRDRHELFTCESCGRLLWYDPARDAPQRKPVEGESIAARIVRETLR